MRFLRWPSWLLGGLPGFADFFRERIDDFADVRIYAPAFERDDSLPSFTFAITWGRSKNMLNLTSITVGSFDWPPLVKSRPSITAYPMRQRLRFVIASVSASACDTDLTSRAHTPAFSYRGGRWQWCKRL